jgi:hypothetical protein
LTLASWRFSAITGLVGCRRRPADRAEEFSETTIETVLSKAHMTATCPRTGSLLFVRDELLELTECIEVACPICDHWHVWDPSTLTLSEPRDTWQDDARRKSG